MLHFLRMTILEIFLSFSWNYLQVSIGVFYISKGQQSLLFSVILKMSILMQKAKFTYRHY